MLLQRIRSSRFDLRGLSVIAALLSLCVSNNVGPSFLPLPVTVDSTAENLAQHENNLVTRSSSRAASDVFRIPMMVQPQKRAYKEHDVQPIAAAPKVRFLPQRWVRINTAFNSPLPSLPAASVSQPPGRAPPRLS